MNKCYFSFGDKKQKFAFQQSDTIKKLKQYIAVQCRIRTAIDNILVFFLSSEAELYELDELDEQDEQDGLDELDEQEGASLPLDDDLQLEPRSYSARLKGIQFDPWKFGGRDIPFNYPEEITTLGESGWGIYTPKNGLFKSKIDKKTYSETIEKCDDLLSLWNCFSTICDYTKHPSKISDSKKQLFGFIINQLLAFFKHQQNTGLMLVLVNTLYFWPKYGHPPATIEDVFWERAEFRSVERLDWDQLDIPENVEILFLELLPKWKRALKQLQCNNSEYITSEVYPVLVCEIPQSIRIMTFNIGGVPPLKNLDYIRKLFIGMDLIAIQEFNKKWQSINNLQQTIICKQFKAVQATDPTGALLTKHGIEYPTILYNPKTIEVTAHGYLHNHLRQAADDDMKFRYNPFVVRFRVIGTEISYLLISVHLDVQQYASRIRELGAILDHPQVKGQKVFIVGDFNSGSEDEIQKLQNIFSEKDMRMMNTNKNTNTLQTQIYDNAAASNGINCHSFTVKKWPDNIRQQKPKIEEFKQVYSDHCPCYFTVQVPTNKF